LFEDPAEFTYGILMGHKQRRQKLAGIMETVLQNGCTEAVKEVLEGWLANQDSTEGSRKYGGRLKSLLKTYPGKCYLGEIANYANLFTKKSYWVFCGDGAAYDIAFSGIDHVLASGEDINVLVFDTEVYSNTGGQASKATPTGSSAKFAASGKKTPKKDMGAMFMSYGYVYVASVAMGADKRQLMKALSEAESYKGPSLIMAYAPCINHGIKKGMGRSQEESRLAVVSGYWPLYRYNPALAEQGRNPFILDCKEPDGSLREFLAGEVRYAALQQTYPEQGEQLVAKLESEYLARYRRMARMAAEPAEALSENSCDNPRRLVGFDLPASRIPAGKDSPVSSHEGDHDPRRLVGFDVSADRL
jgi:pyruvate-ferredoxin/flavodoxin oxidoreductase